MLLTPLDYATSKQDKNLIDYLRSKGGVSGKNPYLDNMDGTVTDTRTGLSWMRCSVGQTWDGSTCIGKAGSYKWVDANNLAIKYAGRNDWRLPSLDELDGILDRSRKGPAINISTFPGTPSAYFWSSTCPTISRAYSLDFDNRGSISKSHDLESHVRLVCGSIMPVPPVTIEPVEINPIESVASCDVSMDFDSIENATMKGGESAFIFYLSITNNQSKQIRIELPFSTYVTAQKEEIEQDVWLSGLIIGGKGSTIRAGTHRNIGLVFHKTKLPSISINDHLYVVVDIAKPLRQYTFSFRCTDQAMRKFVLVDVQVQPSTNNEALNNDIPVGTDISPHVAEIFARFDRLEKRFEESMSRTGAALATILAGQSTVLETIAQLRHSNIDAERFTIALSELRQALVLALLPSNTSSPSARQRTANSEQEAPALDRMSAFTAWLLEQDVIPLSELRTRLLPLDLLPGAVINDINERALDLTGEPALEEAADNVIVRREVLLQVIAD